MTRSASLLAWSLGTVFGFCTACNTNVPTDSQRTATTPAPTTPTAVAPAVATPTAVVPASVAPIATPTAAPTVAKQVAANRASSLTVKRFVVTTGIKDREPLADSAALVADGTAIYAFAELANPSGDSENVRITFERKGGAERVGNVTLPIPGQVPRHRTWATTRFIRAAGVWDAVLWNEAGTEIGRTSFEVAAAS